MANKFKRIIGREEFGGEWFLRVANARPSLAAVWPGGPSVGEPEAEERRLIDGVLSLADVHRIASDATFAKRQGYGDRDVRLLRQAWKAGPPPGGSQAGGPTREPPRPAPF